MTGIARRTLLASVAGGTLASVAHGQEARFFRLATGGVTGTYYAIGGLIADALSSPPGTPPCDQGGSCGVPGLVVFAQTSDGSIANLDALAQARIEGAIAQADLADAAFHRMPPFAGLAGSDQIRALAHLYTESVHLVVRPDSGIRKVADLVGRRVALDDQGSGTLAEARIVLGAFGLSERDVVPYYIRATPAVTMMKAGTIDAMFLVGGFPLASVTELVNDIDARLIPIEGPEVDGLIRQLPFLSFDSIAFGAYPGVPHTPTIGVGAQLYLQASLADDLVYAMAAAFWRPQTLAKLRAGHPKGRDIALETALDGISLPLHPGAERYYREVGALRGP